MTTRPTAGITRLKGRYWNENAVSGSNPGGFDESADGLTAGHVVNYPNSLVDVGDAAAYVGDVADQIVATQSTIVMSWDAGTSAADPGAGKLRASTATVTAGTYNLYASTTDAVGVSAAALLAAMGASTSTVKARGRLVKVGDPAVYLDLLVTGVTGSGAFRTIAVSFVAGPGGFAAGDVVVFGWVGSGDTVRWLSGAGAPGGGTGNDGDYYINTTTGDVHLKSAGAWGASLITLKGTNGTNGATWFSGAGAPAGGLGANGDFYFRTDNGAVYTKAAGAWSVAANITGGDGPPGADGLMVAASNAETAAGALTNKGVTPAGGKAAYLMQGLHTVSIPAAGWRPRTTAGAASSVAETATNKIMVVALDFDPATNQYAQATLPMPKSWDRGVIYVEFIWRATSGSGSVVWGIQALALSDGDTIDTAFGSAVEVTDALISTTAQQTSAVTAAITVGNSPAVGDRIVIQIYRNAAHASDTLAVVASLMDVRITYGVSAATDA